MYKSSNYGNYKGNLFLIALVKLILLYTMDGENWMQKPKQSTILNLRMQLEDMWLWKDLKSQHKTEFVFISGPR